MSSNLDLKVTGPGGTLHLRGQPSSFTLGQLADQIEKKFEIPRPEMKILYGFPPKVLKGQAHTTLLSLGIANRASIRVTHADGDSSFLPSASAEEKTDSGEDEVQIIGHVPAPACPPAATATNAATQFAEITSVPLHIAELWCDIIGGGNAQTAISTFFTNPNALEQLGVVIPPAPTKATPCPAPAPASASGSSAGRTQVSTVSREADGEQVMVLRRIESDNSCLFNAIGFCLERNRNVAARYRQFIVEAVRGDASRWHAAILGKPRDAYCAWIADHRRWGGEIEMIILAEKFKVEIAALNIQTQRKVVYGAGNNYHRRVYVVYSGIHYDALAMSPLLAKTGKPRGDEDTSKDTTVFSPADAVAEKMAMAVVADLHKNKQFTDMAGYQLQCMVCRVALRGNAEAVMHAKETGHQRFGQLK